MNNSLKIGLDIHGVIDAFPTKFKQLSYALAKDGAEIHIITGIKRDSTIDEALTNAGIRFSHYFSIVEHFEGNGEYIEWRDGLPYAHEDKWNSAKSEYCKKVGIDFMFDDSPKYLETFHDIDTTYLRRLGTESVAGLDRNTHSRNQSGAKNFRSQAVIYYNGWAAPEAASQTACISHCRYYCSLTASAMNSEKFTNLLDLLESC